MNLRSLWGSVLRKLRGKHNSIRYRFIVLPKEYVKLLLWRGSGHTWIEYYAKQIDTKAAEALSATADYLDVGKEFLTLLKDEGLLPEHRLLDYGCGILRGGLQFVPYLNEGNYVGVDISKVRLAQGRALMREAGIDDDRYTLHYVRDCLLEELGDRQFDFVWAHAVLMHMPEEDIVEFLTSLKRHLAPGAVFYFTYFPSEKLGKVTVSRIQVRDFYYPTDYLKRLFEKAGYDFVLLPKGYQENWGLRVRTALKPSSDGRDT